IYFPLDANLQMQSELAVPLISASGRMLGVLNLESPLKHAFSEDDRMLLQSFATQAVIAIQEVSLLDAMQEIPQLLLTQPKADVFQRLTGLACDLLNAPVSLIWQQEEDTWRLLGSFPAQDLDVLHPAMPGSGASSFGATLFVDKSEVPQALLVEALEQVEWSHAWLAPLTARPDRGAEGVFCVFTGGPVSGSGGAEWEQKVLGLLSHFAGMASFYELHQNSLRKAQEQHAIAEMFAAVGDLATNLLHQLNNKVGTIPVRVQGIQDKCADLIAKDRYLANNLAEIERSASDAMVAVRQNLSHLHPVQMVPVNLAECVRSAMRNANLGTDVQVHFAAMDDLPEVVGGQQNLTLVFTNLLENAAHAMRMQGRVEISGRSAQEWVEVRVKDSGPGIPTEKQERIFELNYSSGSASHAGKLGFGLWWVRALMVRLGGAVWVESDGHSGAEFVLRFPRQKGTV
ncbi:MAG: GAF domain-containing protein, partial [Anaerolineae bacterium]|nr:GAF domain-containing protein [Anaerolineae bacterium]